MLLTWGSSSNLNLIENKNTSKKNYDKLIFKADLLLGMSGNDVQQLQNTSGIEIL